MGLRGPAKGAKRSTPEEAEHRCRDALIAQGHTPAWSSWPGAKGRIKVICRNGHECYPLALNVIKPGRGACDICGRIQKEIARAEKALQQFRDQLKDLGCEDLGGTWEGANTPRPIRCPEGHLGSPTPGNVQRGQGPCRVCKSKSWDAFYVVTSRELVKFGITSGDPTARLNAHRRVREGGFTRVHRVIENFSQAREVETRIIRELPHRGYQPARGREYFDISALPVILALVDDLAK